MMGTGTPESATRSTISGTAAAASSVLTVTRTNSDPAFASAITCSAVPRGSAVSVLVIDCTTMGCPDPTGISPTRTVTVFRRGCSDTTQPPYRAVNYARGDAPVTVGRSP